MNVEGICFNRQLSVIIFIKVDFTRQHLQLHDDVAAICFRCKFYCDKKIKQACHGWLWQQPPVRNVHAAYRKFFLCDSGWYLLQHPF